MDHIGIILGIIVIAAIALALHRKKKRKAPPTAHNPHPAPAPSRPPAPGPEPGDDDKDHTAPGPNPGAPDPTEPNPPADSPEVLIDRNGKWPYDTGYDPRVDRPKEEFSPVEPQGAYYSEGPFDPNGRWVGPDGVHWTDKHGVHHGP